MEDRKKNILSTSKIFLILSFIFLIISLSQNAYFVNDKEDSVGSFGLISFLLGWMFMFDIKITPWLANPLLIFSYIFILRNSLKKAKITSVIAVFCGISFLFFDEIIINEGGTEGKITGYDIGYWLWLFSLIINFVGVFISSYKNKS